MLKSIIEAARLSPEFCASLANVPTEQFREWLDGKRPIPAFAVPELSAVLGVSERDLLNRKPDRSHDGSASAPAIWFKLRDSRLGDADRELVGLVRRLGFSMKQLDEIRNTRSSSSWNAIANAVSGNIDRSAPPAVQGSEAAARFRSSIGLAHGETGIGELIRHRLRMHGLVVIETPISKSSLEGCCFEIGADADKRPCVFANTFRSTWFRRNAIIMHEVCHAIFDLANDPVSLDFVNEPEGTDVREERAHAFSQACLIPYSVLNHYSNQLGIHWDRLTVEQLAELMASVHVEQRLVLKAAYSYNLISNEQLQAYSNVDCAAALRSISPHAWNTREYMAKKAAETPKWIRLDRNTTISTHRLRLPSGYVQQVIEATNSGDISFGKGAEMLMMDRYTFASRFKDFLTEPALA